MSLPPLDERIRCPHCAQRITLAEADASAAAQWIETLMAEFGPDRAVVESYLEIFRTPSGRGLAPKRMRVLLEDLLIDWQFKRIVFRGRTHNIPAGLFRAKLREIGQRADRISGAKDHHYLYAALLNSLPTWGSQEAAAEQAHYEAHRRGTSRREESPTIPAPLARPPRPRPAPRPPAEPDTPRRISAATQAEIDEIKRRFAAESTPEERAARAAAAGHRSTVVNLDPEARRQAEDYIRQELRQAGYTEEEIAHHLPATTQHPEEHHEPQTQAH